MAKVFIMVFHVECEQYLYLIPWVLILLCNDIIVNRSFMILSGSQLTDTHKQSAVFAMVPMMRVFFYYVIFVTPLHILTVLALVLLYLRVIGIAGTVLFYRLNRMIMKWVIMGLLQLF